MAKYKTLWKWMIIPLLVMQAGIFYDYWGDFSENTWAVHVHYWLASAWYVMLMSQPWLFAKGNLDAHRTWGIFGMALAGGLAFTSISQFNRDLTYANAARDNPADWLPFTEWFFIMILLFELILITSFIVAVSMSILRRKSAEDHAWWLVSTVFILLMPAVARGLEALWIAIYGFDTTEADLVMDPLYVSQGFIIALTLASAAWLGKLRHPATYLAVGANAALFLMVPVSKIQGVQELLRTIIAV